MNKSITRLLAVSALALTISKNAHASVFISINTAPPPLPVYQQPLCPGDGYIWTPGYWAYADPGYYWVPGTWVPAPRPGYLWTPPYWAYSENVYVFHPGYWGPRVGFYGGVNYGYGYVGSGYQGGRWEGDHFAYNRAVNNVNVTNIHNTYNTTVINNTVVNRVSYNGGNGGTTAHPSADERAAEHEQHIEATNRQIQHERMAQRNPSQQVANNHGQPPHAATQRPAEFGNSNGSRPQAQHPQQGPHPQQAGHPPRPPANGGGGPHPPQVVHNGGGPHPPPNRPQQEHENEHEHHG